MLTLIIALLMLFIGYHVGAAHLVERLSKRVHEGTFAAMFYNKKTARWEKNWRSGWYRKTNCLFAASVC